MHKRLRGLAQAGGYAPVPANVGVHQKSAKTCLALATANTGNRTSVKKKTPGRWGKGKADILPF